MHWRPIPGFPGYEACDDGRIRPVQPRYRVRPVERFLAELVGEQLERRGEVLAPWIETRNRRDAARVSLRVGGVKHNEFVHRLVALAWHGLPPSEQHTDVAHKNHNSLDNRASNLEWSTHADNIQANYDREIDRERRFIQEEALAEVLAPHGECSDVPF